MSVLEMVKGLTGLNSSAVKLPEILQKLPSFEELQDAATPSRSASIDSSELDSLQSGGSTKQNPLFEENIEQSLAAEILARFEKFYAKTKKTGIAEIDEIRKQAVYLKFIAQECAERSAAGQPLTGEVFSLEEWRIFSQEVFHDTGNNITFPLTTGKRKDPGKMGAGSGGLGDKITKREFEAIVAKLKDEKISDEARNQLRDILIRADNVEYSANGNAVEFLDENIEEDKAKIRAVTLARETCEELFEPYVQALLLDPTIDFVALIEGAFGGEKIDGVARLMLRQIQSKVALIVENKKRLPEELDAAYEERLSSELAKIYKDEIEPYFVRFLKVSSQGRALIVEMQGAIEEEKSTNYRVNDLSFPQRRLAAVSSGAAITDEKRPSISIPQANSLVVDRDSCPILSNLSAQTRDFIANNPKTIVNPIEYKGANYFKTPADHLKSLLEIYTGEDAKLQPTRMAYPHEIFVQIRAAMLAMDAVEIAEVFNQVRAADDQFDAKFDEKFNRRNEWLVGAELTNLHNGKVCENVGEVLMEMAAGKQQVYDLCFAKKDREVSAASGEVSSGATLAAADLVQDASAKVASKKAPKKRVSCMVIVDSSGAFQVPGNPLGTTEEKAAPYRENTAKLLRLAHENGVDRYVLTTDKHPQGHHNFLKNLLQDDFLLNAYARYVLQKAKKAGNQVAIDDLGKFLNEGAAANKPEIIAKLDSIAPFGLTVEMPQILQTLGEDGSLQTVGVKVGKSYYAAASSEKDGVKSKGLDPLSSSDLLTKDKGVVTEVSTWPSHSFDETMFYENGGVIQAHFEREFDAREAHSAPEQGLNINQMIEESSAQNGGCISSLEHRDEKTSTVISVSCKGQNPQIENYSPFFNEALGVNREAMVEELLALYAISQDAETLTIPLVGIAYDFCVKNRALDTMNFIAPALQALQLLRKVGVKVDKAVVEEVVGNIANIVEERIKSGDEDIKAGVSFDEALNDQYEIEGYFAGDTKDHLLEVEIVIPRGATIEISDVDQARTQMEEAAKKQKGVSFSEPKIEHVFNNTKSLSRQGSVSVQASQLQRASQQQAVVPAY